MAKKTAGRKKSLILLAVGAVLLTGGALWGASAWHAITSDQMGLFEQTPPPAEAEPSAEPAVTDDLPGAQTPTAAETAAATPTPIPTPTPTLSPYEEMDRQADHALMKDTLNVLLIGVDYADERVNNPKQYVGKQFNSDVMLVMAINFKQRKADLISLPRDSYAKIANLDGVYKLNYALQAGGGMKDAGFLNVCKSAQIMLGNIPVNYYIAVTMPVVKELTDAIGGVDYDVDIEFSINGRYYKKGKQHLDGQGVLDYCRIRKGDISAQAGDLHRVNRQKKMLLTVFGKLKNGSTIFDVPKLLLSMQGKVFTNMNFSQLAALAVFGKDLPEKNVELRTMPGSYQYGIFTKNYVLIDQTKRVKLIRDVYGVDVKPQYKYSSESARLLWAYMQGESWLKEIKSIQDKDAKLTDDQKKLTNTLLNGRLADAVSATQRMLSKYRKKAQGNTYIKSSETQELEGQVKALHDIAYETFYRAGYRADWSVQVYKKGQPVMRE